MHVIAKKALEEFWLLHPNAKPPMESWYKIVVRTSFSSFDEIQRTFNSADYVDPFTIFNVGGNNFRIIAAIHYNRQKLYIRHVLTHSDYDRWSNEHRRSRRK